MKCVIIANGDFEYKGAVRDVLDDAELIICADGGARHLKAVNIHPHVLIGDFDSIQAEDKMLFETGKTLIITHPVNKDKTDTHLCIDWAVENQATDISLLGVTGTRMDFTLANIYLLTKLARKGIPARIINSHNEIYLTHDYLELKGWPGEYLSLIPVSEKVKGITLKGLEYKLENAEIQMGDSLGISNMFRKQDKKKSMASVHIREGVLLVIKSKD